MTAGGGRGRQAGGREGRDGGGRTLAFVTGNAGKAAELAALAAPRGWRVRQDARGYPEIQAGTLAEVTEAGADALLAAGLAPPFLLEDSGLFVDALRGFPGVYSRHALDTIGCGGILRLLAGRPPAGRGARFAADLLLVEGAARAARRHFAGTCAGRIAAAPAGSHGFGFDPVFVPDGGDGRTFAEMAAHEKSRLSHRGRAVRALLAHLDETAKP